MNMDFYDNILDNEEEEVNGIEFNLISTFRIIDYKYGFGIELHKLFKRSYKGYEEQVNYILNKTPLNIKDITGVELNDFKINKLYKGYFIIHFYENKTFDIYLKNFEII